MTTPSVKTATTANTRLNTWFERDNQYVGLVDRATEELLIEWWDEAVTEAVEDGFLNPRDYHATAVEYYNYLNGA